LRPLEGKTAVVTGASRGAGRGVALVLGEAGATVYLTGRSVRGAQTSALAGTTLEDTTDMMAARGGVGIPVRTDHTDDGAVAALFERVKEEQGRLDLLVNNAWGGYEEMGENFGAPFWEEPMARFDRMFSTGVRSHLVTTRMALPLMMGRNHGLIINTTIEIDPTVYDEALFYRTSKLAINYLTFGMAHDLRVRGSYGLVVLGVAPGWMRTEAVMENFRSGLHQEAELEQTESTEYIGRAVLALATDPDVMRKSGQILRTRDLAHAYGFTDTDGRQPL
jgi:NAD(P)-dependent dehydrogenase (short-subunit alcohol dehydrogenase family)